MLKSLFSGVSGLQSHQIAMDVESNNIANVNTVGYKYSRANFSDLLAQTSQIATAPQGQLGGKNAVQVGLGTTVASVTRIHSQGSIQNTDKNTDVAIQGDGFFIVSPDGGNTYKYTRSGDFKFDANGNFVDNNGFIAQGWVRDDISGLVDSTAPITNIEILPGLTTPAQASTGITMKANLNSGSLVENFSPIYSMDATGASTSTSANPPAPEDIGILFDSTGKALDVQNGQGTWISYAATSVTAAAVPTVAGAGYDVNITLNGTTINSIAALGVDALTTPTEIVNFINNYRTQTGVLAQLNAGTIELSNDNSTGTTEATKNIRLALGAGDESGFTPAEAAAITAAPTAFAYLYNNAGVTYPIGTQGNFSTVRTIDELRLAIDADADSIGATVDVTVTAQGEIRIENTATSAMALRVNTSSATDINATANTYLNEVMSPLSRNLPVGTFSETQPLNHATHSSSIDIFDSLGSKHTVRIDFIKVDNQQWRYIVTVPNPATIDTALPLNILDDPTQLINFDANGALNTSDINFSFDGNNGSSPNQPVTIDLGTFGGYDGLTSFDSPSATSGISQDGFPGGDLLGIRIDQSGTLVGSFSNGRSFGLAQISMAKFANNEGLVTDGGNVYLQSANSGAPIVGTAATAGRGFIQSAALEASNVDLSRSLTQLIIIQRGYQANGKTITTSDQLLETLIGLKR